MLGVLFTFPSVTSTLAGMGTWSSPIFDEMWPYVLPVLGLTFIAFVLSRILGVFHQK